MPEDDLPRSPTGRVPQWVLDEALGRGTPPPGWRDAAYDTSDRPLGPPPAPPPPGPRVITPPECRSGPAYVLPPRQPRVDRTPVPPAVGRSVRGGVSQRRQAIGVSILSVLLCLGMVVRWVQNLEDPSWEGARDALLNRERVLEDAAWGGSTTLVQGGPSPSSEEAAAPIGTPVQRPAGGAAHAFQQVQTLADGTTAPVAWSPCRPVHYVVDVSGAPTGFAAQVDRVAVELAAATGLVLVSDGTTSEPATLDRAVYQPDRYGDRWAPVLIRFSDDEHVAELAGSVAGLAGPRWLDRGDGLAVSVSGIVLLDTEILSYETGDGEPVYVPVLRHELAHAMGLDHVEDESQLMNPLLVEGVGTFQDGDLDGLAALGRGVCAPEL